MLKANQPDGFDCPGCAWGDPEHGSSFEFCENGVKAVAWESTTATCGPDFFARHTVAELRGWSSHDLEKQGRLTHPLRYDRESDRYLPVDWDAAFALIAERLNALPSPDRALFYTSGRASNEAAFLWQLFARLYGTNNLPDCSNMCHEASGVALKAALGTGKGTVRLEDFEQADAIFVFGQNPGTNHPRMLGDLKRAAERGAKIVVFNPLKERGLQRFADPKSPKAMLAGAATEIASAYFQPRPGGDLAIALGMAKRLFELEDAAQGAGGTPVLDRSFIADRCDDPQALRDHVAGLDWADLAAAAGLSREDIVAAADIYAASDRVIFTWAMGITQHRRSVETIRALVNLLMLRGNLGRPGAGACPVRGHSNVQGDRTVGIDESPPPAFLDALGAVFGFDPPREHGLATVPAIQAMAEGRATVFLALGGNFAEATPDTTYTAQALARCDLTVQISTKLNRSHLVHGTDALILPCLARSDSDLGPGGPQTVSVEDSMSMVHGSTGLYRPASPLIRSEPWIVAHMARATLGEEKVAWAAMADDYDLIRDKIEATLPALFADYNARLRRPRGFDLGNPVRDRRFPTQTGRARFACPPLDDGYRPVGGDRTLFTLMTIRSHDQYNTTIYGLDDRYRGVKGDRRVLFMNPADADALGLSDGTEVTLAAAQAADGRERRAEGFRIKRYDLPRGALAAYYPETNCLIPVDSVGLESLTPTSKSIPVTVETVAIPQAAPLRLAESPVS